MSTKELIYRSASDHKSCLYQEVSLDESIASPATIFDKIAIAWCKKRNL